MTERRGRRSLRLPAYDYASPGAYFVTVRRYARACFSGEIERDEFVIMPNRHHAISFILPQGRGDQERAGDRRVAPTRLRRERR